VLGAGHDTACSMPASRREQMGGAEQAGDVHVISACITGTSMPEVPGRSATFDSVA